LGFGTTTYPLGDRDAEILNTHPGTRDTSWGESCTDGELLECTVHSDCEALADSGVSLRCFRGVCVLADPDTCYRHADCVLQNKLCSADGRCVEGIWQVENSLEGEAVDFEMYAEDCTSAAANFQMEAYDMYGASPWQRVPGILEMFGMCSYRNWYEYLELIDPKNTQDRSNADGRCAWANFTSGGGHCAPGSFDVDATAWWDTGMLHSQSASPSIRSRKWPGFSVEAHECDRDYMHLQGVLGCAPRVLNDNSAMGIVSILADEQQAFLSLPSAPRTFNAQTIVDAAAGGSSTAVRDFLNMVGRPTAAQLADDDTFRRVGFMGLNSTLDGDNPDEFKNCSVLNQCFPDEFTFLGAPRDRESTTNTDGVAIRNRASSDACGGFGVLITNRAEYPACGTDASEQCCLLDGSVAPLYRMLCGHGKTRPITVLEDKYDSAVKVIVEISSTFPTPRAYLQARCNNPAPANPFGGGAAAPTRMLDDDVDAACSKLGDVYLVPRDTYDKDAKRITLEAIRDALNALTDAFVPPTHSSGEADYLAATECSVALYAALRATTECTDDDKKIVAGVANLNVADKPPAGAINPYCTKYHLEAGPGVRSAGMYYFLTHTLQVHTQSWLCLLPHTYLLNHCKKRRNFPSRGGTSA
jgi:hypothetical protein